MNRKFSLAVACVLLVAGSAWAVGDDSLIVQVVPSLAPNAFGGPSFDGYAANAVTALENDLTSYGDANSPTYYQAAPHALWPYQNIVTGFTSWNGQANPTGAFANEYGNRLHFGLHVYSLDHSFVFSLADLRFEMKSTDGANKFGWVDGFSATDEYSAKRVGIWYDENGTPNYITSGPADQPVNELVYVGAGDAPDVYPWDQGATNQDKINAELNSFYKGLPWDVSMTYSIVQDETAIATGSATVTFVPEPLTMLGVFGAVAGIGAYIRRRTA